MKPYSVDLREKMISVYEAGNTSIRKVAERFKVNKNTVQDLVNRKREKRTLEPSVATGGKPSQLSGYSQQIEEMVAEHLFSLLLLYQLVAQSAVYLLIFFKKL
ncbi:IS630 transposase-related protein [Nostoc sp. DSM 114159]|jgi:transposase